MPTRKVELYRRCVDALLKDWDATRGFRRDSAYSNLSDDRKERIFEHVAGSFYEPEITIAFPENELIKRIGKYCKRFGIDSIDSPKILKEIEQHHGILERSSIDSYSFSHTSFHEYFTARDLLARRQEMVALKNHYEDEDWAPVIEFMAAMHEDPAPMLEFLRQQSRMENLKNYPSMARRTRHLQLLYRCLRSGAALDTEVANKLFEHMVTAQIEMERIYRSGGVFPVAILVKDGVKHAYFYFNKRPTLSEALQPYRALSNEILLSPLHRYSDVVMSKVDAVAGMEMQTLAKDALLTCLLMPLASTRGPEVHAKLSAIKARSKEGAFLEKVINDSLEILESDFM